MGFLNKSCEVRYLSGVLASCMFLGICIKGILIFKLRNFMFMCKNFFQTYR